MTAALSRVEGSEPRVVGRGALRRVHGPGAAAGPYHGIGHDRALAACGAIMRKLILLLNQRLKNP